MSLPEEQTGVNVLRRALEMPLCKIVENAGQHGPVILETVRRMHKEQGNERIGYDVMRGSFVDMVDAGIIDPVKVTKGALQNAASVAAMVLSTEALITDKPERQGAVRRGGNYGAMPDYEDGDF
jgi:chaperonin GroEL